MAKSKSVPMLDRDRPFGVIFPGSPKFAFEQDGRFFDAKGRLSDAPPEEVVPADEPPPVDQDADSAAVAASAEGAAVVPETQPPVDGEQPPAP